MKKLYLLLAFFASSSICSGQTDNTPPPPPPIRTDSMQVFSRVETEAQFPGGLSAWKEYLVKNIQMDRIIKKAAPKRLKHWEQTAQVRFMVDKQGKVTNIEVINPVHPEVEKEAIRLLTLSPAWTPGTQNGRPVRSYHTQPITFVVDEE